MDGRKEREGHVERGRVVETVEGDVLNLRAAVSQVEGITDSRARLTSRRTFASNLLISITFPPPASTS